MALFIIIITLFAVYTYFDKKNYEQTSYFQTTHHDYWQVKSDSGLKGEYHLYRQLQHLEGYGYKMLHNLYLQVGTRTQELDLLLITDRGLFAIESKNYSGWVFGNENNTYWTQTFPNGRDRARKEKFYNPIMQNRKHCEFLKKCLNADYIPIFSVIVFGDKCEIKDITVQSDDVIICKSRQLTYIITEIIEDKLQRYSTERIDAIFRQLLPYSQVDEYVKQRHLQNAKAAADRGTIRGIWSKPDFSPIQRGVSGACPNCGGQLVLRQAKKGAAAGRAFYGCSNFPKCKYTKNI